LISFVFISGKHLISLDIHPLDTRDSEKRATFHGFSLNTLQWGLARPGNYYTRALYQPGLECCSNRTITFNIREADQMRLISYIVYQLHIFESGIYGNKAAPTPIPENEVISLLIEKYVLFFNFKSTFIKRIDIIEYSN
jgi:hypothetical protein